MSRFSGQAKEQFQAFIAFSKDWLSNLKNFIKDTWQLLLLIIAFIAIGIWITDPIPHGKIYLATGPIGSSYEELGKEYQKFFEKQGVKLELVTTEGAIENIEKLTDKKSKVVAAFVTSGSADKALPNIETLGAINYEPLWCFYQTKNDPAVNAEIPLFFNSTLNVGPIKSGSSALAQKILTLNGLDPNNPIYTHLNNNEAVSALKEGKINGLCLLDQLGSKTITELQNLDNVTLLGTKRASTYSHLIPGVTTLIMPMGGFSLAKNSPSEDTSLISTHTEILVVDNLHPAVQTLFLLAAKSINSKSSFFTNAGEFPAFKNSTQTLSDEAQIFYDKGAPKLMSYFPFWFADLLHRLFIKILPFVAIAYPFIRSLPNYQKKLVSGKIAKLYGELKLFEQDLDDSYDKNLKDEYYKTLNEIDTKAISMKIVPTTEPDYYTLRSTIDYVRSCLDRDAYEKTGKNNNSL